MSVCRHELGVESTPPHLPGNSDTGFPLTLEVLDIMRYKSLLTYFNLYTRRVMTMSE